MTAAAEVRSEQRFCRLGRKLTRFDVELGRPDALPADALNRALLRDVAIFPQLHAAVLVRADEGQGPVGVGCPVGRFRRGKEVHRHDDPLKGVPSRSDNK